MRREKERVGGEEGAVFMGLVSRAHDGFPYPIPNPRPQIKHPSQYSEILRF